MTSTQPFNPNLHPRNGQQGVVGNAGEFTTAPVNAAADSIPVRRDPQSDEFISYEAAELIDNTVLPEDTVAARLTALVNAKNRLWPAVKKDNDPRLLAVLDSQKFKDEVGRLEKIHAYTQGPERAAAAGVPHPADEHLDAIWAGNETGFSHDTSVSELALIRDLRTDLANKVITPRSIIGTGYRGNTRKYANDNLDQAEARWVRAIETNGRSVGVNVSNARGRLQKKANGE
jgi:hypothetical protein